MLNLNLKFCNPGFDGKTHLVFQLSSSPTAHKNRAQFKKMSSNALKDVVRDLEATLLTSDQRSDLQLLKEEGQKMVSQLPSVNNAR